MCSIRMASTCRWWTTASAAIMSLILTTLHHLPVPSSSWKPAIGWRPSWSMWVEEQPEAAWTGFSSHLQNSWLKTQSGLGPESCWAFGMIDWLHIVNCWLTICRKHKWLLMKICLPPPTAQLCRGGGLHSFHLRQLQCSRHEGKRWREAKLSCFFPHINFASGSVKRSDWIFRNSAATVERGLTGG